MLNAADQQQLREFMINAITTQTVYETFPTMPKSTNGHEWFGINERNQVYFNWRNRTYPFDLACAILEERGNVGLVDRWRECRFGREAYAFTNNVLGCKAIKDFKAQLLNPTLERDNLQKQLQSVLAEIETLERKRNTIVSELENGRTNR